jgi:hypothetical protein
MKKIARLISIDKIEEFARIMDDSIDTTALRKIRFSEAGSCWYLSLFHS